MVLTETARDPEVDALIDGVPVQAVLENAGREQAVGGAYEGASRTNQELALWAPPMQSADVDLLPEKALVDARVRDLDRNDALVHSGADLRKDNIVGELYMLNAKPAFTRLGLDETWAQEFQEEVEELFTLYVESPRNWLDASRRKGLTDMVRMAVGLDTLSGEVLATAEWLRDAGRTFSTAIQMVDTDRLSNPMGQMDGPNLRKGVAMNSWGAPVGYWIQVAHPSDFTMGDDVNRWKFVPAAKPWGRAQVLHVYEQRRPDQSRGVSDIVAGLKELRITKKFRDITLQQAVINATYAASIESELPSDVVYQAMGAGNMSTDAIAKYAKAYLGAVGDYTANSKNMHIDGVKIPHFFPGTKLNVRSVGTPGGVGTDFEKSLLRYLAALLGVSYPQLSRDYSETNYSGLKAGVADTERSMRARKRLVADTFATFVYMLWLEEAINKKQITSLPRNAPSWYEGLNAEAYAACEWIGASRGQIDELKETQAAVLRLKYGLSTQEAETARFGRDWRKVNAQQEREKKDRKARGLDEQDQQSNQMNAASGTPRDKTGDKTGVKGGVEDLI